MSSFKQIPIGYIDQQYAYLYSKKACVLSRLNRKAEAATYYHKFKKTRFSHTPQGQESIWFTGWRLGNTTRSSNSANNKCPTIPSPRTMPSS